MTKAISLLGMLVVFWVVSLPANASDVSAANTAIARKVFSEILTKGRFELAKDLYSPTFINHGLHSSVGLAEDQAMAQGWKAAFPDLVISVDRTIAEGDYVSVIWTARGKNTGKGNGLPGNGRSIEVRGITVWRIVAGTIRDEWSEFDTTEMLRQLGVAPQ
jgi:steroid delta-isomerase-like uncharacterized protein